MSDIDSFLLSDFSKIAQGFSQPQLTIIQALNWAEMPRIITQAPHTATLSGTVSSVCVQPVTHCNNGGCEEEEEENTGIRTK